MNDETTAFIANLKMTALRELKVRTKVPLAVPAHQVQRYYDDTLNAIMRPTLEALLKWIQVASVRQEAIDRWIVSCLEVQSHWEAEHRRVSELEDELIAIKDKLATEVRWRHDRGQLPADQDKAVKQLIDERDEARHLALTEHQAVRDLMDQVDALKEQLATRSVHVNA